MKFETDEFIPSKGQTCGAWANELSVTPTIPPAVGTAVGEDFLIPLNVGHEDGFALLASFTFTFTFLLVVIASRLLRFGERQRSRRNWRCKDPFIPTFALSRSIDHRSSIINARTWLTPSTLWGLELSVLLKTDARVRSSDPQ